MTIEELRAALERIENDRRSIHTTAGEAALTADQEARWAELDTEETGLRAQLATAEEAEARRQRVAESRAKWGSTQVAPASNGGGMLDSRAGRQPLIDANLRAVQGKISEGRNQEHFETLLKRHANNGEWAANLLGRSQPAYESGWSKLMCGRAELLNSEERAALAVGTNTQGGYLVPTHLDPTLILTNSGTSNAIRQLARVVTLTGGAKTWHGVTTAGVTASWDAELDRGVRRHPVRRSVSIPTLQRRKASPGRIEAFEDIAAWHDVLMLFADGKDRLEGTAHATGSGSQPKGIFTALDANTNVEITSTTAATIGEVDLHGSTGASRSAGAAVRPG
jgi:HK97 family phage major capsid protein